MRENHKAIVERRIGEAARRQQRLEAERWWNEVRPRTMRRFAARVATISWSRALLKVVLAELYPDDLFTALVGNVDRLPRRKWPQALAIAVALRHSGRADSVARMARRLSGKSDARHPSRSHTATRRQRT
jgi:hypothetical protein